MKKKKTANHKRQERQLQTEIHPSGLRASWFNTAFNLWKHTPVWMIVFWGWVMWVSLWIDQVPAEKLKETNSSQKLMDIEFNGMRFEQKYNDGVQIVVEAPRARIDQDNKILIIEKPVLTHIRGKDAVYTARGEEGTISLMLDQNTALPSSFERLTINGNAMAKSGATSVTSNRLIFDCSAQLFYGLGRYESDQSGMIMRGENMKFDPVNNIISNIRLDELNEILSAS